MTTVDPGDPADLLNDATCINSFPSQFYFLYTPPGFPGGNDDDADDDDNDNRDDNDADDDSGDVGDGGNVYDGGGGGGYDDDGNRLRESKLFAQVDEC